jgi:hypothetical protein
VSEGLYLEPLQAATHPPTAWENELGDALEAAFAGGVRELDDLVAALNASRVRPRDGGRWTAEIYARTIAELGAP